MQFTPCLIVGFDDSKTPRNLARRWKGVYLERSLLSDRARRIPSIRKVCQRLLWSGATTIVIEYGPTPILFAELAAQSFRAVRLSNHQAPRDCSQFN